MRLTRPPSIRVCNRAGLTLIEVMIAIMIFTVGALGLAATAGSIVRQMALNSQRDLAASIAGTRSERFHALPCPAESTGTEEFRGLQSEWSIERRTGSAEQSHRIVRSTPFGPSSDKFMSGVPCG